MFKKEKILNFISSHWPVIVLTLVLVFSFIIRLHFLSIPFERDEGEYAYMGQMILKGIPPYESAYNMKFPGTFGFYAVVMFLFGQSVEGIHFGFLLINILSSILIYLFFSKIINRFMGLFSATLFSLMSLTSVFMGFAGHATNLVVFFVFLGFYFLTLDKLRWHSCLISGMCFSIAVLMKQHGVFFIIPGFLLVIQKIKENYGNRLSKNLKIFSFYVCGLISPLLILVLYFIKNGIFKQFYFWTIIYPQAYTTQNSLSYGWDMFKVVIRSFNHGGFYVIFIFMIFGVLISVFSQKIFEIKNKRFFLMIFFLTSFLTIVPGFYFRGHYFITLLPAVALFASIFIYWIFVVFKRKYLIFLLILIMLSPFFIKNFNYFFVFTPNQIIRYTYGRMPFIETKEISKLIKDNTKPDEKIFVFGSEPEVYFYSKRTSASKYIYMYPLMEKQPYALNMQKEMVAQVEQSMPEYFLFSGERTSWLLREGSELYVFSWVKDFLKNYKPISVIDINPDGSVYKTTGKDVEMVNPFNHFLTLYKNNR